MKHAAATVTIASALTSINALRPGVTKIAATLSVQVTISIAAPGEST